MTLAAHGSPEAVASPRLVFENVVFATGSFHGVFNVGLHTLIGGALDGPLDLLKLAAGETRPRRGRVLLDGSLPHGSPKTRRSVAATTGGALPQASSVRVAIEAVAELRAHPRGSAAELLESWGASGLLQKRPHALSLDETALVQLALALSHQNAKLLALWRPFSLPALDPARLLGDLFERARNRVVLVGGESTPEPGRGGNVLVFLRGAPLAPPAGGPVGVEGLSLWIAAEPVQGLVEALVRLPGSLGVEVLPGKPGLLRVGIAKELADQACRAALWSVHASGVALRGLRLEGDPRP